MNVLEQHKNKTIVYAVLNWGLGHATRSIPIIRRLVENGNKVILISDGEAMQLLTSEFQQLECQTTARYKISYTTNSIWINLMKSIRSVYSAIKRERETLNSMEQVTALDLVISDGRYGVRSSSATSIFICHQVKIYSRIKLISYLATKVNLGFINKFDNCWIMDDEQNSIAGSLSNPDGLKNFTYVGPSSRMVKSQTEKKYDICIVLSGIEPKRSHLEEKLNAILSEPKYKICLVRGTSQSNQLVKRENIDYFDLLQSGKLNELMSSSSVIICRSGYSSIMDLMALDKKAILIPTQGQTEQEYLAQYHDNRGYFKSITEKDLSKEKLTALIDQLLN